MGSLHLHRATTTADQITSGSTSSDNSNNKPAAPTEITHNATLISKGVKKHDNLMLRINKPANMDSNMRISMLKRPNCQVKRNSLLVTFLAESLMGKSIPLSYL